MSLSIRLLLLCVVFNLAVVSCGQGQPGTDSPKKVVQPQAASQANEVKPAESPVLPVHISPIAGSWYPGDATALRSMLKGFFDKVPKAQAGVDPNRTIAVILPHAGYPYSAQTASYGVALLAARQEPPKRIILLGPSHTAAFRGVSVGYYSASRTPLGDVPIDLKAVERLRKCPLVQSVDAVNQREHSVDIEVPLLQYALGKNMPPIVPIVVGRLSEGDYATLADALRDILDKDTVLVISSDFTHYGPNYDYLPFQKAIDAETSRALCDLANSAVSAIESLDRKTFDSHVSKTGDTICGFQPIEVLLEMLPQGTKATWLHYDTSGGVTGVFKNSVSYVAMAFVNDKGWTAVPKPRAATATSEQETVSVEAKTTPTLSPGERTELLNLARATVEAVTAGKDLPDLKPFAGDRKFQEQRAVFVTLNKNGRLCGCIGSIFPEESLVESVRNNAVNAATRDPRYEPVTPAEVPKLHIEISVLTVPKPIASPNEIKISRDGVILQMSGRSAVFLPQVAPELGWSRDEMLSHLSQKAGLDADAWRESSARFLTFQAEVFGE